MEILKVRVLRGPNFWSNYRKKLIVLDLDLKEFEHLPTNRLNNFTTDLVRLLPSLDEHQCSYKQPGGFIKRLEEGTWLGHVIEHVALELQSLAGMHSGFGRTRSTAKEGVYNVVYSYQTEKAGIYAGKLAVHIVKTLANGNFYNDLEINLQELKNIHHTEKLGPSTKALVDEALKRKIPCTLLENNALVLLGHGCHQKMIWATVTNRTSLIGGDIAADKVLTKHLLEDEYIPVPMGIVIESEAELESAFEEVGFPMVIKPFNANHGRGVNTNIQDKTKALLAYKEAAKISNKIIIEKFIQGFDYRFLVINYKLVAVAKRTPAMITGTGRHTIQQLVDEVNKHPKRGYGHDNSLTHIAIDEKTHEILLSNNLTLDTILPAGQEIYLRETANLSTGGTATDVTDEVHPHNVFLAERIARLVNLDICGIDILAKDVSVPITKENGAVVEVNAGPGFRMHLDPTEGKPRNVAKAVIDMLFPPDESFHIPITAVTGTNGKTTVVRLIAHMAEHAGRSVGFTTTDGIYINNTPILKGDCSGPNSAAKILRDPIVDFAVLETARGGILRAGLGFEHCHVSIITNISEDHLGLEDINDLEDLARVKAVVARSTFKDGYTILNADDDKVYEMRYDVDCNIAFFSMHPNNPRILAHCEQGGLAAYIENGFVVVRDGNTTVRIVNVNELAATFYGTAVCMVKNILPTVLTGIVYQFNTDIIARALTSFQPSAETTPGRMNVFKFSNFKVMIDYAHNPDAFENLKDYLNKQSCGKKVGIIAATGDRREEDIKAIGRLSAEIFDEIIIRHDQDSRGRSHETLTDLLMQGIDRVAKPIKVSVIPNEFKAIQHALDNAVTDSFIFYFPDDITSAIEYVKKQAQQMRRKPLKETTHGSKR